MASFDQKSIDKVRFRVLLHLLRSVLESGAEKAAYYLWFLDDSGEKYKLRQPRWTQHADFIDPFAFIAFLRAVRAAGLRDFDVMLETKAKDLALLRLREDVPGLAPDLAPLFAD